MKAEQLTDRTAGTNTPHGSPASAPASVSAPGGLSRRRFLARVSGIAGATMAAGTFGPLLQLRRRVALAETAHGVPTVVVQWNNAALQAIRVTKPGPPMVARALAVVHTCIYDAWTAYDPVARPTQAGGVAKVHGHRSHANKTKAISYAAFRGLLDLFPSEAPLFTGLMTTLGYDPADTSTDTSTPSGIGNVCAQAIISFRHGDGSNQLNKYVDTTGYPGAYADYPAAPLPVNTADVINDPNHWQPLHVPLGSGNVQTCNGPHWGLVTPFALTPGPLSPNPGAQFRPRVGPRTTPFGPGTTPAAGYVAQAQQMLAYSAALTDEQKAIAEYWKDGPRSELPPGHWMLFGQLVSQRDQHDLDDDVRMFFALANAVFDAGIAAWDAKRYYNSVRPITAIRYLWGAGGPFAGQPVSAWAGPCRGTWLIDGGTWVPHQPANIVTPPFPEFISGHSTFSAAAAEVLKRFTGSDEFGASATFAAGSSTVEPGCTPATDVTLSWATFSEAADQAGLSRRYGGIHFQDGDLAGRAVGRGRRGGLGKGPGIHQRAGRPRPVDLAFNQGSRRGRARRFAQSWPRSWCPASWPLSQSSSFPLSSSRAGSIQAT